MKNKSFTIIELLVVISIIGLLSSIVIISMWSQRAKARDASIQSFMHQVRNAAEVIYSSNNGSYAQVCDEDDTLIDTGELGLLEDKIEKDNGSKAVKCLVSGDEESFAVSSPLVSRAGKYWCVESAGISTEMDDEITSAVCE